MKKEHKKLIEFAEREREKADKNATILSKEQMAEISGLFSKLSLHSKNIDKLSKSFIASRHVMDWDNSDNVKEVNDILHSFLKKSIESGNNTLSVKVIKVMSVVDKAALVFWKAATYEIMAKKYESEIQNYQSNELEFSERIKKLEEENNNLKQNLEL